MSHRCLWCLHVKDGQQCGFRLPDSYPLPVCPWHFAEQVEDAAGVDVDTVSPHIHERVSAQAIVQAVQLPQPKQLFLFADPDLPLNG